MKEQQDPREAEFDKVIVINNSNQKLPRVDINFYAKTINSLQKSYQKARKQNTTVSKQGYRDVPYNEMLDILYLRFVHKMSIYKVSDKVPNHFNTIQKLA